jgi:dihydroorotate dehydrogenase electron transfer subunit
MKQLLCTVISNREIMPGTYLMWLEAPDIAARAQPGQFVTVKCGDFVLRRPLSIHQSRFDRDSGEDEIAILFRVVGKGTSWLSQRREDDKLDILGPFGNGFTIPQQSERLLLVAGGIGIAPLVFLMQRASPQHEITLVHGAKSAGELYTERCKSTFANHQGVHVIAITEDGSAGRKGMATHILPEFLDRADRVYACGPPDMYKAMAEMSLRSNLRLSSCQVSLEVHMGCGFGACYGCTINTGKGLKRVCRDGPVFELGDIIWQEVCV